MKSQPSWGTLIRDGRLRKQMSQRTLAEKLGVSQAAVSLWERDSNGPSTEQLGRLLDVLELDITEFYPPRNGDGAEVVAG